MRKGYRRIYTCHNCGGSPDKATRKQYLTCPRNDFTVHCDTCNKETHLVLGLIPEGTLYVWDHQILSIP